jgi:hypothetical protein
MFSRSCSTILVLGLAALLASCASPLDSDAPRKETAVTAAPKVVPSAVTFEVSSAKGQYASFGTPTIRVDTTTQPCTVWIGNMQMTVTADPGQVPLLQSFTLNVDSISADSQLENLLGPQMVLALNIDSSQPPLIVNADATNNTASLVISELDRKPGEPLQMVVSIYIIANKALLIPGQKQETLFGEIHITM